MDSADRVLIVWHDDDNELHYRVVTGTQWSDEVKLTDTGKTVDASSPVVLVTDADGRVHMAWKDNRDGPHAIYYRCWNDGAWGPEELIARAGNWLIEQDIAVGGDGRVHAAYVRIPLFKRELHYRCRADTGWTADTLLTQSQSQVWEPCVGSDAEGRVHVIWEDVLQGDRDLYAMHCLDGQWTAAERLTNLPTSSLLPNVAVDARGTLHLVWSDDRNAYHNLYFRRWTAADGWSLHERVTIDSSDAYRAVMTTDASGNVHMVWSDNRDGNKEIYYAMRPPDEPWGPEDPDPGSFSVRCLPNPCRGGTCIRAHLPAAGDWTVRIFDLQGRLMGTVRETVAGAGYHDIDWNGRTGSGQWMPLGLYFIRVSGGDRTATTRLVYARP